MVFAVITFRERCSCEGGFRAGGLPTAPRSRHCWHDMPRRSRHGTSTDGGRQRPVQAAHATTVAGALSAWGLLLLANAALTDVDNLAEPGTGATCGLDVRGGRSGDRNVLIWLSGRIRPPHLRRLLAGGFGVPCRRAGMGDVNRIFDASHISNTTTGILVRSVVILQDSTRRCRDFLCIVSCPEGPL